MQGRAVQESLLAEADLAEASNTAQEKHSESRKECDEGAGQPEPSERAG